MGKVHRLSSVVEEYKEKWLISLEMVDIILHITRCLSIGAVSFKEIKTCRGNISSACSGRIKSYKGYIWQYYEDIVDAL